MSTFLLAFIPLLTLVIAGLHLRVRYRREFIVHDGYTGLLYEDGRLVGSLAAGRHIRWGARFRVSLLNLEDLLTARNETAEASPSERPPLLSVVSATTVCFIHPAPAEIEAEPRPTREVDRTASVAGVPLWLLRSEHANPGGLLRETLLTRPSPRDY